MGAGAALTDGALFNGFHVALGTLVWAGVLTTALLTLPRADRDAQASRLVGGERVRMSVGFDKTASLSSRCCSLMRTSPATT